jgi:hypothetical protein
MDHQFNTNMAMIIVQTKPPHTSSLMLLPALPPALLLVTISL